MMQPNWSDMIGNWYDWLNDAHNCGLSYGHFAAYLEAISEEEQDGSNY